VFWCTVRDFLLAPVVVRSRRGGGKNKTVSPKTNDSKNGEASKHR
jgi:hypothetical protein